MIAQSLADVAGIEPAREHERHAGIEIFEQTPVERPDRAHPAASPARRSRVEQQTIGDRRIDAQPPRGRFSISTAIAFITGKPNRFLIAATRAGVSLP